ncbi:39S ribosomal protein L44, mitochondrial [Eupeodes corollae]|uniref:39S ribosomal protein L44, mitochondrial n=1 Tax=Eupeodes corollae TaxID=290404 RepID=UPI00248F9B87|nr:39S ribosomal protein L44, mitochondrial [Eupeodes corollae]
MSFIRNTLKTVLLSSQLKSYPQLNNTRSIKRWVAPTLRELRRRREKLGPELPEPRSQFLDWNYSAELYAFGKRLNEEFDQSSLQSALTNRSYIIQEENQQREVGIEEPQVNLTDNTKLMEKGAAIVADYIDAFLRYSLPKVPEEGIKAFAAYLMSEDTLAHVSRHLGLTELVFSGEYPPSNETMARSLLAVIGSLQESSGSEKAFSFIRDFICTQLNQKDLSELWVIEDPVEYLKSICKDLKLAEPEPRLIGEAGKNTVLAAYQVAIYSNKVQIGQGFGEDTQTAIQVASLDALRSLFGIQENMTPFNFEIQVDQLSTAKAAKRLQK